MGLENCIEFGSLDSNYEFNSYLCYQFSFDHCKFSLNFNNNFKIVIYF